MKKEYVSPLFEEVVLMTQDVLSTSDYDPMVDDPKDGLNDFSENDGESEFTF